MAPGLVNRGAFDCGLPGRIFGTDVTQFRIGENKSHLSPIIDFHTREIVAFDISERPNMLQIKRMMIKFADRYGDDLNGAILHSNQVRQNILKKLHIGMYRASSKGLVQ